MDPISNKTALAAAGAAGGDKVYVDDVFSTYVYEGQNTSTNTINNGLDLAGEGGLVWIKRRDGVAINHFWFDTERTNKYLSSNNDSGEFNAAASVYINSYTSTGFVTGDSANIGWQDNFVSWSFRKAPGFFDVVTYTGTGSAQNIAHNLGSVPGMIVVKNLDTSTNWIVYHRSTGETKKLELNGTGAAATNSGPWNNTAPTSSVFTVGTNNSTNGDNYVAYLFAHDDLTFGEGGDQSAIKCGSLTTGASGVAEVDLGWEPQWLLVKTHTEGGSWYLVDNMRGFVTYGSTGTQSLLANSTSAESGISNWGPTTNGFKISYGGSSGIGMIYMAIRRPHKPPESGTDVFSPIATSAATGTNMTTGFPVDWQLVKDNRTGTNGIYAVNRLTGVNTTDTENNRPYLQTSSINLEGSSNLTRHWDNTGYDIATPFGSNSSIYWNFRRAPGFSDVVTWAGDGSSNRAITHNLGVTPELLITKRRTGNDGWWSQYTGIFGTSNGIRLDQSSGLSTGVSAFTGTSAATSSVFYVGSDSSINSSYHNYVAYLFATLPGISKVGTYTGTGSAINVDCGFTAGARFVLIKRTDSTGDWYVWDSTRGIVSGNDPYLLLNSTAVEVTSTDYIDPLNAGFTVTSTAPAALNASGGTYIFLAIA